MARRAGGKIYFCHFEVGPAMSVGTRSVWIFYKIFVNNISVRRNTYHFVYVQSYVGIIIGIGAVEYVILVRN